jgi:hypothetical protein
MRLPLILTLFMSMSVSAQSISEADIARAACQVVVEGGDWIKKASEESRLIVQQYFQEQLKAQGVTVDLGPNDLAIWLSKEESIQFARDVADVIESKNPQPLRREKAWEGGAQAILLAAIIWSNIDTGLAFDVSLVVLLFGLVRVDGALAQSARQLMVGDWKSATSAKLTAQTLTRVVIAALMGLVPAADLYVHLELIQSPFDAFRAELLSERGLRNLLLESLAIGAGAFRLSSIVATRVAAQRMRPVAAQAGVEDVLDAPTVEESEIRKRLKLSEKIRSDISALGDIPGMQFIEHSGGYLLVMAEK